MITLDLSLWIEVVCVLLLIFILNAILYKPIRRILEERESKMSAIRDDIERFERNAESLVQSFNKKLAEARMKGKTEMERLKQEAREQEKQLLAESTKEADAKKQELMSELTAQIEAAKKELLDKAEAFAVEIAQKLLGRAV